MAGALYIVSTPIGNLKDITLRALDVLKNVDIVLAEDTRVTRKLLDHFDIQVDILSYHQQSGLNKKQEMLDMLLQGKNLALVSDAGTPGISDPGNELVDYLHASAYQVIAPSRALSGQPVAQRADMPAAVKVISVPGPSSVTAALSICGFNVGNFSFIGFWPKKKASKLITKIDDMDMPVVFFESPYRILKTLALLGEKFPEKRIFVGQELTKMHERTLRGSIGEVKAELEKEKADLGRVKGEIVCVLEG